VFLPAVAAGFYALAVIGVVASVIGAYYYLRIVKIMFFDAPQEAFLVPHAKENAVMALTAFLVLFYVVWPAPLVDAAATAAKSLF
jgi:NADH-quinone oxidoreductase subunit N